MKVIDLLNKIANGEIPEKIKFLGKIWIYDDGVNDYSYFILDHCEHFLNNISFAYMNEEVEIIEDTPKENKKIEKFKVIKDNSGDSLYLIYDDMKLELTLLQAIILDKINEIIDKVNGE